MLGRLLLLLVCCVMVPAGSAVAQVQTTYHGCVDASGRAVESILDPALTMSFETRIENGRAVIRYNPDVLPRLQPATRMFLFGHECARLNLGIAADAPRSADAARRADCRGLTTLMRSQLLGVADFAVILADLQLSADEWQQVPGPARRVDLFACYRDATSGFSGRAASVAADEQWNACTRGCADTLLACQQRVCRGPACEPCVARYEQCVRSCDERFPR